MSKHLGFCKFHADTPLTLCETCLQKLEKEKQQLQAENERYKKLLEEALKCQHNGYKKGDPMLCPQCREAIQKVLEDKT
jgi:hypothetical protein